MAKIIGRILVSLIIFSLSISVWVPIQEAFRVVFGGFYVLIAPGLVMTYAFFKNEEIHFFERFPFAYAFSLTTVPLTVFSLFRLGMTINAWTILASITGLIILALMIVTLNRTQKLPESSDQ